MDDRATMLRWQRAEMAPAANELDVMSVADAFVKSGYFADVKSQAQAVVKILAGQEAGFGPMASLMGIHIVQGKPAWGANLMATAIKKSGRYDYRILQLDNAACELEFYEHGKSIGKSKFTMEDAKAAKLEGKDVWRSFARNMLFARALSNGCRWYCADVFGGVTPYTTEELNGAATAEDFQTIPDARPGPAVNLAAIESPQRHEPGLDPTEPTAEEISRDRQTAWARWRALTAEADALGVAYAPLGDHVTRAVIIGHGKELAERVKRVKAQ